VIENGCQPVQAGPQGGDPPAQCGNLVGVVILIPIGFYGADIGVNGGTFFATDVNIRRNSAAAVDFNSGFIVNGGTATTGTIGLGTNNSNGALTVAGGSLTATGAVTIGNQATAGRGGAMRVIGGIFSALNGLILARNSGTNVNNVASAVFTGGVSTAERITLGFDAAVTAGSATLTLNGGALYLGSGGIVRNGTGTFVSNVNFSTGTLGAKDNWSTSVPITLPATGNVSIKALMRSIFLTTSRSPAACRTGGFTKAAPARSRSAPPTRLPARSRSTPGSCEWTALSRPAIQ
jgi:hypothetical protein